MKFRSTYAALRFGPIAGGEFVSFTPIKTAENEDVAEVYGVYETDVPHEVEALTAAAARCDYITVEG